MLYIQMMLQWLRLLYGRFLCLLVLHSAWIGTVNKVLLLLSLILVTSCSNPLSGLVGGPQVNTNAQVGATNSQTIGQTKNETTKVVRSQARVIDTGDKDTKVLTSEARDIVVNESKTDYWLLLLALIGWLLPSPGEMARITRSWFTNKKDQA